MCTHLLAIQIKLRNRFNLRTKNIYSQLKCCGVNAPEDWTNKGFKNLPAACCDKPYGDQTCTSSVFKTGCKAAFKNFVSEKTFLVAGVAIGVGVFQVSAINEDSNIYFEITSLNDSQRNIVN